MNRALFAIGVGVVALSMAMMGCATDVSDPLPPEPTVQPGHPPPEQTLSGDVQTPVGRYGDINALAAGEGPEVPALPQQVLPPVPMPER